MTEQNKAKTVASEPESLDFDAHYCVRGYKGIAWYLIGFKSEPDQDTEWTGYEVEDRSRVVAVMVGDDRKFTFDVEDVQKIDEDDFCHVCGQIGCRHDGRERD
jgi:hypothetical protein